VSIAASPPRPLAPSRQGHGWIQSPEPAPKPASPFAGLVEGADRQPARRTADPSGPREAARPATEGDGTSQPHGRVVKAPDAAAAPPGAASDAPVEAPPASSDASNPDAATDIAVPAQKAKADPQKGDHDSALPAGAPPEGVPAAVPVAVAVPTPVASVPADHAPPAEHADARPAPTTGITPSAVPPPIAAPGDTPVAAAPAKNASQSPVPASPPSPDALAAPAGSPDPNGPPAGGVPASASASERSTTAKPGPQGTLQAPSSPAKTSEEPARVQQPPAPAAISPPPAEPAALRRGDSETEARAETRGGGERLANAVPAATDEPAPLPASAALSSGHERALIQAFAGAGAHVAAAPPTADAGPLARLPIAGVAVEIAAQALAGKNRFEIRLDPPELGRIDVRLDVDRDGRVTSRMTVERPETLHLLRREAPQLERALQDAGFKTGDNAMQFSLRDQGSGGPHGRPEPLPRAGHIIIPDPEAPPADAALGYGRPFGRAGALDIRV
jgi:hypothetical protein